MNTTTARRPAGLPLLLAVLMTLAACSGGSDSGDIAPASDEAAAGGAASKGVMTESLTREASDTGDAPPDLQTRAVISTGVVSLRSADVAAARFDLQRIVDVHRGEVAEERTQTDDDGGVRRTRLVVRVPVAEFDETMSRLEDVAELRSSSRHSEDVTTEVIDIEARIRAQSASLQRIELLLARARSIRDIVAIEAQLARRQADLDSLKSQQAWLADQTSLSTITVLVEQKRGRTGEREDGSGFLAGLERGWDGLRALVTGTLTVTGLLLPFTGLLLVLGVPTWLALRVLLRRRVSLASPTAPAEPPPG